MHPARKTGTTVPTRTRDEADSSTQRYGVPVRFQISEAHTKKRGIELDAEAKIRANPKAKTTAKAKPKANPAASEDHTENHYETIENQWKQLQDSLKMIREALGQTGDTREDTHQTSIEDACEITDIHNSIKQSWAKPPYQLSPT